VQAATQAGAEIPLASATPASPVAAQTAFPVEDERQDDSAAAAEPEPQAQGAIPEQVSMQELLFQVAAAVPAVTQAQVFPVAVARPSRVQAAVLPSGPVSTLKDGLLSEQLEPESKPTDDLPRADLESTPDALLRDVPPPVPGGNPQRAEQGPTVHRSAAG
jgi:hypothetical protein